MIQARDKRIVFLMKAMIAMAFIAKISLGAFLPIPRSFLFLVYQQGLHPFVNVFLCFLFGVPLMVMGLKARGRSHISGIYKLFVYILLFVLTVQTVLQMAIVGDAEESFWMQIAALASSLLMVVIYGLIIPSLWNARDFLFFVQKWAGILVIISLFAWLAGGGAVFKGGRFIGIFKHIPHMVTCATIAFIFSLGTFSLSPSVKHKIWSLTIILISFLAVILTGTRSSAGAILLAALVTVILHRSQSNHARLFKFAAVGFALTFTFTFGVQAFEFAKGIATGAESLAGREAQDGVSSRWEEFERGKDIFVEAPWLGHGLLSKFAGGGEVEVSSYNSFKDPHNIFISAGVIGGWPLLFLSVIAVVLMTVGGLKALRGQEPVKRQIAIYLLAHIPILVIYHVHLSLGGMADRMYWLVFGFVAANMSVIATHNSPRKKTLSTFGDAS
jgi:Lipid A core - O-antigen ligase and related enzymes